MIYISIGCVVIICMYLFYKQRQIIKYLPVSHKGLINLYNIVNSEYNNTTLYKLYFNIFLMFAFTVVMVVIFKLNLIFTITILIVSLLLIPLLILWQLNFEKEAFEFNNLVTYLNQCIIVFKSYPKVYATLIEIENAVSGNLNCLIEESINNIKSGESIFDSLYTITKAYPHFILHNLHTLVCSVEQYGTSDYYEALDLIQDDIDDWLEDVSAYNFAKKRIINKVTFLIGFAVVICFMALRMLSTIDININGSLYQLSIFFFCMIQIFTYVISVSLLNSKWIESSEKL